MDRNEHQNRQYKTTYTSPELRKAQCDIARVMDPLQKKKKFTNVGSRDPSSKRFDWMIQSITTEIIILFTDGL